MIPTSPDDAMIHTLLVATHNPDKSRELQSLLEGLRVDVTDLRAYPQCPDVEEDGTTLEANAIKKAESAHAHTGLPVIADDTGLFVDYLDGSPGVYSARYAGENATYRDNVRKLLRKLTQVPKRRRSARFICVIAFVVNGKHSIFTGTVEGEITFETRGSNGFGYDPIFLPAGLHKTFAELDPGEKNLISHRGRALAQFVEFIQR